MSGFSRIRLFLFFPLAMAMAGCFTQFPTPGTAVSGDIIQIGLGGIKRNSDGSTLTAADISATITDDNGNGTEYDLHVAGLYRAYPDYTSTYAREVLDRNNFFWNELEPYDGMWWVTLLLTDVAGVSALPLLTGPAIIKITSPKLIETDWTYEGSPSTGIPIEILPGSRQVTQNEKDQYFSYRPTKTLTISPDDLTGISIIGGIQMKLTYNSSAISANTIEPRFVPFSHDPNINIVQHTVDNGDGTKSLIAMVTNPQGFVPSSDSGTYAPGNSTFADLNFAVVVIDPTSLADGWEANFWLETSESFYIDDNGDVVATVAPVLARSH